MAIKFPFRLYNLGFVNNLKKTCPIKTYILRDSFKNILSLQKTAPVSVSYFLNYDFFPTSNPVQVCYFSSNCNKDSNEEAATKATLVEKTNQRARLKQAVRDYGATIIVFHVAISLASLGICYLAVSNGIDVIQVFKFLGFSESIISSKVASEGSTFVIAYAVHKVFAPVRIGVTLSIAPLIVRYLRRINWIKPPKKM